MLMKGWSAVEIFDFGHRTHATLSQEYKPLAQYSWLRATADKVTSETYFAAYTFLFLLIDHTYADEE